MEVRKVYKNLHKKSVIRQEDSVISNYVNQTRSQNRVPVAREDLVLHITLDSWSITHEVINECIHTYL